MIRTKPARRTALAAAALAALAVSCGTTPQPDRPASGPGAPGTATPTTAAPDEPTTAMPEATTAEPSRAPLPSDAAAGTGEFAPFAGERVRDAFATLQATLDESCETTDCSYFLGRVNKELQELNWAMLNDPKGAGHFPEPIRKMTELNKALGGDASYENLKKHEKKLVATRDFINTWMQGHPDDYR